MLIMKAVSIFFDYLLGARNCSNLNISLNPYRKPLRYYYYLEFIHKETGICNFPKVICEEISDPGSKSRNVHFKA